MDCEKCPVRKECGVTEEQAESGNIYCPLAALMQEWRFRMLKKITSEPHKWLDKKYMLYAAQQ